MTKSIQEKLDFFYKDREALQEAISRKYAAIKMLEYQVEALEANVFLVEERIVELENALRYDNERA